MASISVLKFVNPVANLFAASLTLDGSVANIWNVTLLGTDPNGDRVIPKFVVVDNTGNNGVAYIDYGVFTYSISPYTRKTFVLLDNQSNCRFQVAAGALKLTFTNINPGVPDEVNQYATSIVTPDSPFFTTFNPADKTATAVLTNSNLTLTGTTTNDGARSVNTHSTGKYYFEWTTPDNIVIGIGNSSQVLWQLGNSLNGIGIQAGHFVEYNGIIGALAVNIASNGKCAIDFTNKRIWFAAQGQTIWNGGGTSNPNNAPTGYDVTALMATGPMFIIASVGTGTSITINTGMGPFNDTVPLGYAAGF